MIFVRFDNILEDFYRHAMNIENNYVDFPQNGQFLRCPLSFIIYPT
jgi:hypothetical protein